MAAAADGAMELARGRLGRWLALVAAGTAVSGALAAGSGGGGTGSVAPHGCGGAAVAFRRGAAGGRVVRAPAV